MTSGFTGAGACAASATVVTKANTSFMRKASYQACILAVILTASGNVGAQDNADVQRAVAAARARAARGDVVAQFSLGSLLYYGSERTAEAISWFRRAA